MIFAGKWKELVKAVLSEVDQNQRDKYSMYSFMSR